MAQPPSRFIEKLEEQLGFLQRSCAIFDSGAEDEALRLATTLRVLFHNTQSSTSLITHVGLRDIKMLSTARGHGDWQDYLSVRMNLASPEPVKMLPILGTHFRSVQFTTWWTTEPVFVHDGEKYTRKKIVLSAANKDGGAHVDSKLEAYYEVLCTGEYGFGITGNLTYNGLAPFPQGVTQYAKNSHFALIRQFAHETLASAAQWPPPK